MKGSRTYTTRRSHGEKALRSDDDLRRRSGKALKVRNRIERHIARRELKTPTVRVVDLQEAS